MSQISVIVISKDDPMGLVKTITSIIGQTLLPKEIIVITKGASNGVLDAASSKCDMKIILQTRSGISNAFNMGIEESKGKWLIFLNGGDFFSNKNSLKTLNCYTKLEFEIITARSLNISTNIMIPRDRYFNSYQTTYISHQATLFKRGLFLINGGYKESYRIRMDFEWMLRLSSKSKIKWINEVVVNFQGAGLSSTKPFRSCIEECKALCDHRKYIEAIKVFTIMMPFRLLRILFKGFLSLMIYK